MWKIIETLDFITKLKTKEITYPFYHQHAKSFDKKEENLTWIFSKRCQCTMFQFHL